MALQFSYSAAMTGLSRIFSSRDTSASRQELERSRDARFWLPIW
jgi:hypothetical protein